jgi:hypothetical protein
MIQASPQGLFERKILLRQNIDDLITHDKKLAFKNQRGANGDEASKYTESKY